MKFTCITLTLVACTAALTPFGASAEDPPRYCGDSFGNWPPPPGDASCTFACPAGGAIKIEVSASDHDATASGSARCGGGHASCAREADTKWKCTGAGVASESQTDGTCHGVVEELWNSAWNYGCVSYNSSTCVGPGCNAAPCVAGICCPEWLCAEQLDPVAFCIVAGACPRDPADPCTEEEACEDGARPPPGEGDRDWRDALNPPCRRYLEQDECVNSDIRASPPALTPPWQRITSWIEVNVIGQTAVARACVVDVGCAPIAPRCGATPTGAWCTVEPARADAHTLRSASG